MRSHRLLVVTPAKNEAQYISRTIASMLNQTVLPEQWIIVDDASTDDTPRLATDIARHHPWITLLQKDGSAERRVGLATVDAIKLALAKTDVPDFDFLCVLDADIELPASYFAQILAEFDRNPRLGIAAGQVYEFNPKGQLVPMRGAPEATAGAVKCWRRRCFEEIGGLIEEPGWDGIDQYQAAFYGWTTRTFDREGMSVLHLRQMGSSHRGLLHGRARRGRSGYFMGSHPLWMLASAVFHASDSPFLLASLATLAGYFKAWGRSEPRINNPELIRFIRKKQLSILRSKLRVPFGLPKRNDSEVISWQQ
jgi:glycosyltransferase involved in cell wall biosynthesis